jgi:hypothetical protein
LYSYLNQNPNRNLMANIEVTFKSVSEIVGIEGIGLVILVDKEEKRQLSLLCDKDTLRQFEQRLPFSKKPKNTLPEVLWDVVRYYTEDHFEVIINTLIDGEYRAMLYNVDSLDIKSVRAIDAVLLSVIAKLPIFVDEVLMNRQSLPYNQASPSMALPVNVLTIEMLEEALHKAIKDENYELASTLKMEIERRKNVKPE